MADFDKMSKEDRERAAMLLQRERDMKAKERAKMADPAYKAKMQYASKVATTKTNLILAKAKAAGIVVTDKEVAAALAAKGVKKPV